MANALVSIIIPAYDEAATIDALLDEVLDVDLSPLGLDHEVLVVDDGSRDDTAARVWARGHEVRLLRHLVNRGKGAAIRTGLAHARGELVLVQDADREYDPADYLAVLGPLVRGEARVVYGSRFARGWPARMDAAHYLANRTLTWLANRLFGLALTDEATGYKAFTTSLLRSLPLRAERFDFCPEVTALLGRRGERIVEVPVRYRARTSAEGKKIGWRDGVQAAMVLVRHASVQP